MPQDQGQAIGQDELELSILILESSTFTPAAWTSTKTSSSRNSRVGRSADRNARSLPCVRGQMPSRVFLIPGVPRFANGQAWARRCSRQVGAVKCVSVMLECPEGWCRRADLYWARNTSALETKSS